MLNFSRSVKSIGKCYPLLHYRTALFSMSAIRNRIPEAEDYRVVFSKLINKYNWLNLDKITVVPNEDRFYRGKGLYLIWLKQHFNVSETSLSYILYFLGTVGRCDESIKMFEKYKSNLKSSYPTIDICSQFLASIRYLTDVNTVDKYFKEVLNHYPKDIDVLTSYVSFLFKNENYTNIYEIYDNIKSQSIQLLPVMFNVLLLTCIKLKDTERMKNIWNYHSSYNGSITSNDYQIYMSGLYEEKKYKEIIEMFKTIPESDLLTKVNTGMIVILSNCSKYLNSYEVLKDNCWRMFKAKIIEGKDEISKDELLSNTEFFTNLFFCSAMTKSDLSEEMKVYLDEKNQYLKMHLLNPSSELLYSIFYYKYDLYDKIVGKSLSKHKSMKQMKRNKKLMDEVNKYKDINK